MMYYLGNVKTLQLSVVQWGRLRLRINTLFYVDLSWF